MLALLLASALSTDPMVPIATFRTTQTIAMFYEVDLAEHNAQATAIAATLQTNDAVLRACYTERLEEVPTLRGSLVFEIHLSPADGGIEKIARRSGTIDDDALAHCIVKSLSAMPFAPTEIMHGTLSYRFDATDTVTEAVAP